MNRLQYCRKKIDDVDKKIVKLLMSRFKITNLISKFKKTNKIQIEDKKRELQVINNIRKKSNKKHRKFIVGIYKKIINYSKKLQR